MFIIRILRHFDHIDDRVLPQPIYLRLICISVKSQKYADEVTDISQMAAKNKMIFTGLEEDYPKRPFALRTSFVEHVYLNRFILNSGNVLRN
jgi:hypothetical protein